MGGGRKGVCDICLKENRVVTGYPATSVCVVLCGVSSNERSGVSGVVCGAEA